MKEEEEEEEGQLLSDHHHHHPSTVSTIQVKGNQVSVHCLVSEARCRGSQCIISGITNDSCVEDKQINTLTLTLNGMVINMCLGNQ